MTDETPKFLYGTAWKEQQTKSLTLKALAVGYRGIDTANQRKHYYEQAVGDAIAESQIPRDQLFLQTKFTFRNGQDHRLPYDPSAGLGDQVRQSFSSSLDHLKTDFIDSYVLHGPSNYAHWGPEDDQVWQAMEQLHDESKVRQLGVSNINPLQLDHLIKIARIKPAFVQNRCFAEQGWDHPVRQLCQDHGITYQGFSLLTANPQVINHPWMQELANRHQKTIPQIVFRFSQQLGMLPLTGTTDAQHMAEDLACDSFSLADSEVHQLLKLAV